MCTFRHPDIVATFGRVVMLPTVVPHRLLSVPKYCLLCYLASQICIVVVPYCYRICFTYLRFHDSLKI
jgi:hypothetical protein